MNQGFRRAAQVVGVAVVSNWFGGLLSGVIGSLITWVVQKFVSGRSPFLYVAFLLLVSALVFVLFQEKWKVLEAWIRFRLDIGEPPERSQSEHRAATRSVQTELRTIRAAIDDALVEQVPPRELPAAEWDRCSAVFSEDTYFFSDHVYNSCRDAYVEADRINHRARSWPAQLSERELAELGALRELVQGAINIMNTVLGTMRH